MTQTSAPAAGATARPERPARALRRAPADLPFRFADRALAERIAAERQDPDWLQEDRAEAAAAFEAIPIEANQLYTPYIDLRAADLFEADPYVTTGPAGLGDDLAAIPKLEGVHVETFGQWLARDPGAARAALDGGGTLQADDKLAQLARGFWSHGRHVEVAAGVRIADPIALRWPQPEPGRALITRTIVTLGAGASASLVLEEGSTETGSAADATANAAGTTAANAAGTTAANAAGTTAANAADRQSLFHGTTEVVLEAGASLALAAIQDMGPDRVIFQHRHARIGEGATLHWALAQLGGRVVRSRVDNRLEGDRSSVEQVEIAFAGDEQLFDMTSYTRHIGRDTTGNLLSKGVLLDRARSFLKGLIAIERSAIGTDSYLGEFGMNLSRSARAVAIPSLEIDQPDCRRAAHSSSVGPIDPAQLFYLESRGISPDDARKFIVLGFLEPVVARVPLDAPRDHLRDLLEAKWAAGLRAASAAA